MWTQATVDNLKPYKGRSRFTQENNLAVKIEPTGRKSYYCFINRRHVFLGYCSDLTLKQAKKLKTQHYADKHMGKTELTKLTFAQFVNSSDFIDWSKGNRKTHVERMSAMKSTILPILGKYKLKDMGEVEFTRYKNKRLASVSESTINREINDISAVMSQAFKQKLIRIQPKIEKFKLDKGKEKRVLSKADINALRKSARSTKGLRPHQIKQKEHIPYIIDIALFCGLRLGELLQLRWGDIVTRGEFLEDYLEDQNIIIKDGEVEPLDPDEILDKIYSDYGFRIRGETNKTGQTRIVPIENQLAKELKEYYFIKCQETDEDFEKYTSRKLETSRKDWDLDEPIDFDQFQFHKDHLNQEIFPFVKIETAFHTARDNAGLGKDVTFHSLRHTFCTNALEAGLTLQDVKDLAGHASITTTEQYLHTNNRRRFVQYKHYGNHLRRMLR